MKKSKRILAILGIIFFLGLYITAVIAAIFKFPYHTAILKTCIFSIFYITLFIALFKLVLDFLKKLNSSEKKETK